MGAFVKDVKDDKKTHYFRWQKLFEDLQAKVEPFMEQLDAFELEKQALLGKYRNRRVDIGNGH